MRLAIVGGKLQGTEAAYLAGKAGYQTVLIDRRRGAAASGLVDEVHELDVLVDETAARDVLRSCDAVLPACEEDDTLAWLDANVHALGVPLLFDLAAYRVTSSKLRSSDLFDRLGVARPLPWPSCGFPLIVKPSGTSGSEGVRLVDDEEQLAAVRAELEEQGHEVVVEEFAPGPSLSLEVVGWNGRIATLQPTLLEFDRYYDCKRVVAPVDEVAGGDRAALDRLQADFDEIGRTLAAGLGLRGVMDIEVMLHGGELKVLEIDARLPSQTPTAVYHSCGVNVVQLLAEAVAGGGLPAVDRSPRRACCYQHLSIAGGAVEVLGEHMMGGARPLRLVPGFHGADEAIVDLPEGGVAEEWVATLITLAETPEGARRKARAAVESIAAAYELTVAPEESAMPGDDCR
jgi:pyrrolysine biosynthesis protein PylC